MLKRKHKKENGNESVIPKGAVAVAVDPIVLKVESEPQLRIEIFKHLPVLLVFGSLLEAQVSDTE